MGKSYVKRNKNTITFKLNKFLCDIERLTIIAFSIFRPKSSKTANFFTFSYIFLCFKLKNKRKRHKKVYDFGRFWAEKIRIGYD